MSCNFVAQLKNYGFKKYDLVGSRPVASTRGNIGSNVIKYYYSVETALEQQHPLSSTRNTQPTTPIVYFKVRLKQKLGRHRIPIPLPHFPWLFASFYLCRSIFCGCDPFQKFLIRPPMFYCLPCKPSLTN